MSCSNKSILMTCITFFVFGSSVCLWIMDPHSRAQKKNTSHGNEVLSQDTTHLIHRPCYQRQSPCKDPAGNWTTRKPPDNHKEMQTAVVWPCYLFIRSGQNHLARHSERGKKTRQTEEEVGRQHQGIDRPRVWQVPEGTGEQGKMEETGCKIICGAPTTLTVKELMMMTMMMMSLQQSGEMPIIAVFLSKPLEHCVMSAAACISKTQ